MSRDTPKIRGSYYLDGDNFISSINIPAKIVENTIRLIIAVIAKPFKTSLNERLRFI